MTEALPLPTPDGRSLDFRLVGPADYAFPMIPDELIGGQA